MEEKRRRKAEGGGKPVFLSSSFAGGKGEESGPVLSSQEELQSLILYSNLNTVCLISRWKIVPLVEEGEGKRRIGGVSD